jgi:hypothetical protein
MYRLAYVVTVLSCLSLSAMEEIPERPTETLPTRITAATLASIPGAESEIYVPENVDVTCCLEESTKFCYVMNILCKTGMSLCEIATLVLTAFSVTEIKDNPDMAWGLGIASAIANGASLALTYATFKMGNKIRKLDRAVAKARSRRAETEV